MEICWRATGISGKPWICFMLVARKCRFGHRYLLSWMLSTVRHFVWFGTIVDVLLLPLLYPLLWVGKSVNAGTWSRSRWGAHHAQRIILA
jgi:hypothetical protein